MILDNKPQFPIGREFLSGNLICVSEDVFQCLDVDSR